MTLELYPASAHDAFHGAGIQYPHHIDEAVRQIYGACKGLGTDEQTLITVLGSKSPETRNLIALRYKELYNQPLKSLLKSETSGDFGRLLLMISTPLPETEAQILRDATKGMGTTESLIIQILSGRTNEEMSILKRSYFDLVGKDLAVTLNSELSGDFRKVVMAVLQSSQEPYNPAVHNAAKAEEDAVALYKAGQGRLGTNEEVFIGILVKAPPEFLKMMDAVYVAKYNNNIAKAVDKEFSGDAKKSLNYLVRSTLDPYPAIAEVFEKTMKGFGTDETGLSTTLVRYQSVLPHVKAAYKKQYHEELRDRISGETSGDYKKLLLEVFDAPQDPPKAKIKGSSGVASSGGHGAAPAGANSPAYLSTQSSYAASTSSLHSTAQGHSASSAYPTPTGQQNYGQSPGAAPSQAAYGAVPHQTPTSQTPGYTSQTSTPQPGHPPEQQYPSSGHQPASQQSQQYSSPDQQPSNQAYPQYGAPPGHQQQPPIQQDQQYPTPGQPYQQYGPPPGQQQQAPSQPYQQYPPPEGQNQPYQQYSAPPGQQPQHPPNQQYQQYPPPGGQSQPYQQYGAPPGQPHPPPNQQYQQYPPGGQSQPYQQYGGQQQAPSLQYQQYPSPGQHPSSQPYQHGAPPAQQQQALSPQYQQYPIPGQPPSNQPYGVPPGQQAPSHQYPYPSQPPNQPYQQYSAPPGQHGYPSPYGAAPPPHQPQYPTPQYPPYRGV